MAPLSTVAFTTLLHIYDVVVVVAHPRVFFQCRALFLCTAGASHMTKSKSAQISSATGYVRREGLRTAANILFRNFYVVCLLCAQNCRLAQHDLAFRELVLFRRSLSIHVHNMCQDEHATPVGQTGKLHISARLVTPPGNFVHITQIGFHAWLSFSLSLSLSLIITTIFCVKTSRQKKISTVKAHIFRVTRRTQICVRAWWELSLLSCVIIAS